MLDLTKAYLPAAVEVAGKSYRIKTDFRYWLQFYKLTNSPETLLGELDFIYNDDPPPNRVEGYNALLEFFNPPRELPRPVDDNDVIVLDYIKDADLIYSAFFQTYKIDLMDDTLRLHWWKFTALLSGITDTKLTDVMGYRSYNENDKTTYEQQQRKLKKAWSLPQPRRPLSKEQQEFNNLFSKTE